jgi:hypothetical protein
MVNQTATAETPSAGWKSLYKVGGTGAIAIVVLYVIEVIGFVAMGPPPATVDAWFTLFRNHGLVGLFDAYLLDAVAVALMVPLFLALYAALGLAKRAYVTLATTLAFVGIAVFLATNVTFSMFYLSSQYATRSFPHTHEFCVLRHLVPSDCPAASPASVGVLKGEAQ